MNLKYKANNKAIKSETKDPNTLVQNKVVKNILKSIPRSSKQKTQGIKTREIPKSYYNYKIPKEQKEILTKQDNYIFKVLYKKVLLLIKLRVYY